jgi:hypothetical protein
MIKKLSLFLFAALLSGKAIAQTELSLNVSNLLINEANVTLEKGLSDNFSLVGFASYVYGFPPTDNMEFINTNFYFGPEVRYYVSPVNGIDRFFIGVYLKEAIGNISQNDQYYYFYDPSQFRNQSSSYSKLAFGLSLGAKWVTRSNVLFGLNMGFGRNIYTEFSNENFRDYYFNSNGFNEYYDFRIGFNLGYRFN